VPRTSKRLALVDELLLGVEVGLSRKVAQRLGPALGPQPRRSKKKKKKKKKATPLDLRPFSTIPTASAPSIRRSFPTRSSASNGLGHADDAQESELGCCATRRPVSVSTATQHGACSRVFPPVWDTALTLNALSIAGFDGPSRRACSPTAAHWLFRPAKSAAGRFSGVMKPQP